MMQSSGSTTRYALFAALLAAAQPAGAVESVKDRTAESDGQPKLRQPALQLRGLTNKDREVAAARARQRAGKPLSPKQRQLLAPDSKGPASSSSALHGAAGALLDLVLAQVGTADLYASPNFANSPLPVATCECQLGTYLCDAAAPPAPALGCIKDSDCPGFATGATCTGPVVAGGIRKFVNSLAPLCTLGKNNIGQCLPVATPDTTKFPGNDYYEIGVKEYSALFHSDLPGTTKLRGYYQKNNVAGGLDPLGDAASTHYLGPIIIAQRGRPVRVMMTNELPTGLAGNLFLPVDPSVVGAGKGPLKADGTPCNPLDPVQNPTCASYAQNRATFHLHGGNTPWISDGTQHQWTAPAGEATPFKKGLVTRDVPDMPTGDGQMSFYWTNDQSGRMMFYHDHAYGITRLNVYGGEAAGYVLVDPVEEDGLAAAGVPGTLAGSFDPGHYLPLVIQDKTFVPPADQLAVEDPTWDVAKWGGPGSLWFPHVYPPNQWPTAPDNSGANPFGRWDYGPWFHPAQTSLTVGQLEVPCYTAAIPGPVGVNNTLCPGIPNPTIVPESFLDTPMVNGTVYPTLSVEPRAYRLQVLNASQERNWNLSLFVADASGTEVTMVDAVPHTATSAIKPCPVNAPVSPITGLKVGPGSAFDTTPCWPATWPTDGRAGGVPDPATVGPAMWQIGSEGGLLPAVAALPPQPVTFDFNRRNIVVLNVLDKGLFMGPAERADVVVDFSAYAGKTLILYNDAPAPVPAFDSRFDYYTGNPDQTDTGGAPTTHAGYGPNTRTIMQIKVAATAPAAPFNPAPVSTKLGQLFATQQQAPVVPQAAYSGLYPAGTLPNTYFSIQATSATVAPIDTRTAANPAGTPQVFEFGQKALHELFDTDYGRMNSLLGVEMPLTNWLNQTTIPFTNFDPPNDFLEDGKPHIWKITHNGVDTHTIHFHLLNLQIVNRVGWDGAIRAPDASELGWKESIRMHPLEDIYVAMKPVKMAQLPWPLPDMWRPLDVTLPLGTSTQFTGTDITNQPITVTNQVQNFGWEYVWHCHLLGHEEGDMLRGEVFVTAPEAPTTLAASGVLAGTGATVTLSWRDASASAMTFNVQRSIDPTFATGVTPFSVTAPLPNGGTVSFTDTIAGFNAANTYYYRVQAQKQLSSLAIPATMQGSTTLPYTASSAWVQTSLVGQPTIGVAPAALAFGNVPVGATKTLAASVTNTGLANLVVSGATLTGAATYTITANTCGTVAPGATCSISVGFTPTAAGAAAGSLAIASNDAASPVVNVALTGTGVLAGLVLSPTALAFPGQVVGSQSAAQTATLTNNTGSTVTLAATRFSITGTNRTNFSQTNTCPRNLANGASCTISVRFTPSAAGNRTAAISVTATIGGATVAGTPLTLSLSGVGIAAVRSVSIAPATLAFGNQTRGTSSATQTVTVTSTGNTPVTVFGIALSGGDSTQFTLSGNTCPNGGTLAVGASCTFNVAFAPRAATALGAKAAFVDIILNTTNGVVNLTGTAR